MADALRRAVEVKAIAAGQVQNNILFIGDHIGIRGAGCSGAVKHQDVRIAITRAGEGQVASSAECYGTSIGYFPDDGDEVVRQVEAVVTQGYGCGIIAHHCGDRAGIRQSPDPASAGGGAVEVIAIPSR